MADKKKKGLKLSSFKTDKELEESGTWIDYQSGARFKIARIGNPKFSEYILKHGKKQMRSFIGDEVAIELMKDAIANTILIDWDNILGDDGKPMQYTVDNAREALDIPDFYEEILGFARNIEYFRIEEIEAAEKN